MRRPTSRALAAAACGVAAAALAVPAAAGAARVEISGGAFVAPGPGKQRALLNLTLAPSAGNLTAPVFAVVCLETCVRVVGRGGLPIVNVPFTVPGPRPALGTRYRASVAACSTGFDCSTRILAGKVGPNPG